MEVLVTGGDTDLGRTVAEGFRDAGHRVVIAGARRGDLEVAAKELDVDAIVFDTTDPASLEEARGQFPHQLDTIVNLPAPRWDAGDPRTYSLADLAAAWRTALDTTVVSAVLTVQILGDHLRSGGSIVNVIPEQPREGSADAAVKAAISDWTAGQATHFGIRGKLDRQLALCAVGIGAARPQDHAVRLRIARCDAFGKQVASFACVGPGRQRGFRPEQSGTHGRRAGQGGAPVDLRK